MAEPRFDRAVMCQTCGKVLHVIRNDWLDAPLANTAVLTHMQTPRTRLSEPVSHDIVTHDFFDGIDEDGIVLRKVFTD